MPVSVTMRHGAASAIGTGAMNHIPPTSAIAIEKRLIFTPVIDTLLRTLPCRDAQRSR